MERLLLVVHVGAIGAKAEVETTAKNNVEIVSGDFIIVIVQSR